MNSRNGRKMWNFHPLRICFLLVLIGVVVAFTPFRVQADSNEATPVPTNTATPLPSFTPEPGQAESENVVNIPIIGTSNGEGSAEENSVDLNPIDPNAAPLPPSEDQSEAPSSFIQSVSGVNQCLIGAIVLGLIAITIMVLYNVVQRIRT